MALYLTNEVRDEITEHGERGYPNEICGLLVGKEEDGRRVVNELVAVENSFEAGEQFHRFLITPEAMLKAERVARRGGLTVLGVYHSHPNAPAIPSEYDRDHAAWTTWSYIIVSVRDGRAAELRAWTLRDDRGGFDEEEIK
ncbi:MAG: Mov34/MPN/PAD-1 family protein [Chloroflexia bacterium]